MKQTLLLILLTIALLSCKKKVFNPEDIIECEDSTFTFVKSNYSLILIIGQSNTHAGLGLDSAIDTAKVGVMQLGRFGNRNLKIIKAAEPLDHHSAKHNRVGFGLTFTNLFKEELLSQNDSVIIIPCGYGGTGFTDNMWNKGDTLYNDAIDRVNYVLDRYPNSKLQAILWHQGEKDVGNKSYELLLIAFIKNIREDLKSPNVPFILGGMVPYWVSQKESRRNQQVIISSIRDKLCIIGYADPNFPYIIEKEDNKIDEIHFDANGQREMGRRYFSEYLKLLKGE